MKNKNKPKIEESKIEQPNNETCIECIKWKVFGKNCFFYWDHKKFCSQRVTENDTIQNND